MSGHSKWATTYRHKAAIDAKRSGAFTKLANAITIAARQGGGDLDTNFTLRLAVDKARGANMPKDNIDRAIKRGTGEGNEGVRFEEIIYEALGPAGSAFIIETITDNKNRTVGNIKSILNKNGGQLGATGSVAWMFERCGLIEVEINQDQKEVVELAAIEAGATDVLESDQGLMIVTAPTELQAVQQQLTSQNIEIKSAALSYRPNNPLTIENNSDQEAIERLYDLLDNEDDINNIYTNV